MAVLAASFPIPGDDDRPDHRNHQQHRCHFKGDGVGGRRSRCPSAGSRRPAAVRGDTGQATRVDHSGQADEEQRAEAAHKAPLLVEARLGWDP